MSLSLTYPETAETLYQSLQVDAFYQTLEQSIAGSSKQKHKGMLAYYDYSMRAAKQHGILCLTEDQQSGASIWSKPMGAAEQAQQAYEQKQFIEINLGVTSRKVYEDIVTNMERLTQAVTTGGEWYLSILGIHPDRQNNGLGQSLIKPVLEQTDHLGIDTYLETFTPRNMPFYQRLGYQAVDTYTESVTGTHYSVMKRASPF